MDQSHDGGNPNDHKDWVEGGTEKWADFESFAISEGGIDLVFAPYQVAAYAYGPRSVILAKDDIHELLRPEIAAALGWEGLRWQREYNAILTRSATPAMSEDDPAQPPPT